MPRRYEEVVQALLQQLSDKQERVSVQTLGARLREGMSPNEGMYGGLSDQQLGEKLIREHNDFGVHVEWSGVEGVSRPALGGERSV